MDIAPDALSTEMEVCVLREVSGVGGGGVCLDRSVRHPKPETDGKYISFCTNNKRRASKL